MDPRQRLLDAAHDVVATDGLEGLTLRAIARRAGVSHGAPLRHFPTLAALLSAVAADGFVRLVATIDERLDAMSSNAGPLTALERIAVAGRAYIEFALADPGVFAVMFRPERVDVRDPGYLAEGYRSFRQLVGLVEAAQAEDWHPGEPADALAGVLWSHVHGLAELALHGGIRAALGDDALDTLVPLSNRLTLGLDPGPHPANDARQ